MSITNALNALFAKPQAEPPATDKRNEITSSFFGSKRFILIIALIAFVYLTYTVLNIELIKLVANVAIVYIICETVSHLALTVCNAIIKLHEVKADAAAPTQGIGQAVGPLAGIAQGYPLQAPAPTQPSKP